MKRGSRQVRLWMAGLLVITASLSFASAASAVSQTIVATAANTFTQPTYTSDQGDLVQFQNLGGSHNVTAALLGPDGGPLFASGTTSGGTTPVNGTQFLTQGSYAFSCTIHPDTMQATLVKTGAGTPVPRPDIEVKVVSRKLDKVASKGKLVVQVQAITQSNDVAVEAKLGKARLGEDDGIDLAAGARKKIVLKLKKGARNRLGSRSKATVKVEGSVAFGSPDTAKGKLK